MAELSATVLEKAVIVANKKLAEFEMRTPEIGVYDAFDAYNELVPGGEITNLRKSASRPTEIAVFNRQDTTIQTVRNKDLTGNSSTTAKMGLSWITKGFEVGLTEAVNADNYMSAAADLGNQIAQAARKLFNEIDLYLAGILEAGKYSAIPASTLMGIDSGAYTTTLIDMWTKSPAVMRALEMSGPYHVLSNVESVATENLMSTYGVNNSQNLERLLKNNYEFGYSKNLSAGSNQEVHYLAPQGSLQLLKWIEYDSRVGRGSYDSTLKYGTMNIEFKSLTGRTYSLPMGYMWKAGPQDKSATRAGLERAFTEVWAPFIDLAAVKQYSSEAGKSSIVKFKADAAL